MPEASVVKIVQPSAINGHNTAPASKSVMQRAIAAALLAEGATLLRNPSLSNDSMAALDIAGMLGARVSHQSDPHKIGLAIRIEPNAAESFDRLDCRESGLCLRMFAPIAALWSRRFTLDGFGTLATRPVSMLEQPLRMLGVHCETNGGLPPITVIGPLQGGEAMIDGSLTSQPITGLLLALPRAQTSSVLHVRDLNSKPYVRTTLQVAADFGVRIDADDDFSRFEIPGNQFYLAREYAIEGDWSGAAFLLTAAALAGRVVMHGLNMQSSQADRAILDVLEQVGAKISIIGDELTVENHLLMAFQFDATDCPDLFPIVAVLACYCEGVSEISGVGRLRHKESDRSAALASELGKLGAKIEIDGETMRITGGRLTGGIVDSHNDHRIVMAMAVAALAAEGEVIIDNPNCVAKSYPRFFADLLLLGGKVK